MAEMHPTNEEVADLLEEIAELLESRNADDFRVRAYRNAAESIRTHQESISDLAENNGETAVRSIRGVGASISRVVLEYIHTGRSRSLDRLRRETEPAEVFQQVPGIGKQLARRVADRLDVSTLEELEQAAHDGRLETVEGFGEERVRNIRVALAGLLRRPRRRIDGQRSEIERPDVETLLDVDTEYRRKAQAGELRKIAPKRFNPGGEAWLPILEAERGEWSFTALFSNTARAHDLGKTDDWVVLYYRRDGLEEQATVVTETAGDLQGRRVVRGREEACRRYYDSTSQADAQAGPEERRT